MMIAPFLVPFTAPPSADAFSFMIPARPALGNPPRRKNRPPTQDGAPCHSRLAYTVPRAAALHKKITLRIVRRVIEKGGYHSFSLLVCQIPLQYTRHFRSGCGALWTQGAVLVAANQTTADHPFNRLFRPVADAGGVGVGAEVTAGADIEAFIFCVVPQDGGELFAGDGGVWLEGAVVKAVDHANGCCPVHSLGVPVAVGDVGEVTAVGFWAAFETMEHGHEHGTAEVGVWLEGGVAGAGHEALAVDIDHWVVEPVAVAHVGEWQGHNAVVVVVNDDRVLAGVAERQGHAAVVADFRRRFKGHFASFLVVPQGTFSAGFAVIHLEVIQIRPVSGVLCAQWGGQGHGEAKGAVVRQFHLHAAVLASDGVDHIHRNAVAVHGHAHVDVGEVGVRRNVAAVHRPGHTVAQVNHQSHVLAGEGFKHFFVQLGAAAEKIHRHRLARRSVGNGIDGFFADGRRNGWRRCLFCRPLRPIGLVAGCVSRNRCYRFTAQRIVVVPAIKGVARTGDIRWQGGSYAVGVAGDIAAVDGAAVGVQRHRVDVRCQLAPVGCITVDICRDHCHWITC